MSKFPAHIQANIDAAESYGHDLVSQGCGLFRCLRCDVKGFLDGCTLGDGAAFYERKCFVSPAYAIAHHAGARTSRRARSTGTTVTLYDGEEAEMDTSDGRWQTVCEDHGMIVCHKTKRAAESWLSHPEEWCDVCSGAEPTLSLSDPAPANVNPSEGAKS